MKHKRRIREGNPVVTIILYLMAGLTAFIALYPMYYILILSLSEPRFAATMKVYLYPKGLDLGAYEVIVKDSKMWRTYRNTILYVVPTTILMVITSTLAAYGLSCRNLRGRKFINMYLLIPMYFAGMFLDLEHYPDKVLFSDDSGCAGRRGQDRRRGNCSNAAKYICSAGETYFCGHSGIYDRGNLEQLVRRDALSAPSGVAAIAVIPEAAAD